MCLGFTNTTTLWTYTQTDGSGIGLFTYSFVHSLAFAFYLGRTDRRWWSFALFGVPLRSELILETWSCWKLSQSRERRWVSYVSKVWASSRSRRMSITWQLHSQRHPALKHTGHSTTPNMHTHALAFSNPCFHGNIKKRQTHRIKGKDEDMPIMI